MNSSQHGVFLRELGQALTQRDRAKINSILLSLLKRDAPLGEKWKLFSDVLRKNGELSLSVRAAHAYLRDAPGDETRKFDYAVALAQAGRNAHAREIVAQLKRNREDDPRINHFLGTLHSEIGHFDEAMASFMRVIAKIPTAGQTWLEISALHHFMPGDSLIKTLSGVVQAAERLPDAHAIPLLYAWGKALDDVGDIDGAFRAVSSGARRRAALEPYDQLADADQVQRLMERWTAQAIKEGGARNENPFTIHVTGLPRSGTTLVEQMLVNTSPEVAALGEANILSIIGNDAGGLFPHDLSHSVADARSEPNLCDLYRHLAAERAGKADKYVDKSLDLSRQAGLLSAVLPRAPIIWMKRRPIDAAWSCYRTHFAGHLPWSWRLDDLAHRFVLEERLMEFWRHRLGEQLLVVPYEELVTDTKTWRAKILAHAGLKSVDPQGEHDQKERSIHTASLAQARRPIYTRAVGSADRYSHHLRPFTERYEQFRQTT